LLSRCCDLEVLDHRTCCYNEEIGEKFFPGQPVEGCFQTYAVEIWKQKKTWVDQVALRNEDRAELATQKEQQLTTDQAEKQQKEQVEGDKQKGREEEYRKIER